MRRLAMCSRLCGSLMAALLLLARSSQATATESAPVRTNLPAIILVVGAPGEAAFESNMVQQTALWTALAERAGASAAKIGCEKEGTGTDLDKLRQTLPLQPCNSPAPLWIVLIGHGTFDGQQARFNLRGPDLTAGELAGLLSPFQRPLVIINTASASAPFMAGLSGTNRIVVTATRSGHEQNLTRFGLFLAESLDSPGSDLDHDGQVSLLEAFLAGSRKVAEFYRTEGRLATEHALLDDNGDGHGTQADWFRGIRAIKKPDGGLAVDGARAHQVHLILSAEEQTLAPDLRARRDALELQVFELREARSGMAEADYLNRLEALLLELARLQKGKH